MPPNMKRKKNSIKAFDKTNSRTFLNKVKNKKSSIFNKVLTEDIENKKNKIRNNIDIHNDYELNSLLYKDALMLDKRICCNYYISLYFLYRLHYIIQLMHYFLMIQLCIKYT